MYKNLKEEIMKTKAASSQFKVALLSLSSTVKEQVAKVNARIDKTANVVRSDAAAQAKVNANVNAEMGRMMKVANHRYVQHLKDDAELQSAISGGSSQGTGREWLPRGAASAAGPPRARWRPAAWPRPPSGAPWSWPRAPTP